jgi:hypothetical protein
MCEDQAIEHIGGRDVDDRDEQIDVGTGGRWGSS